MLSSAAETDGVPKIIAALRQKIGGGGGGGGDGGEDYTTSGPPDFSGAPGRTGRASPSGGRGSGKASSDGDGSKGSSGRGLGKGRDFSPQQGDGRGSEKGKGPSPVAVAGRGGDKAKGMVGADRMPSPPMGAGRGDKGKFASAPMRADGPGFASPAKGGEKGAGPTSKGAPPMKGGMGRGDGKAPNMFESGKGSSGRGFPGPVESAKGGFGRGGDKGPMRPPGGGGPPIEVEPQEKHTSRSWFPSFLRSTKASAVEGHGRSPMSSPDSKSPRTIPSPKSKTVKQIQDNNHARSEQIRQPTLAKHNPSTEGLASVLQEVETREKPRKATHTTHPKHPAPEDLGLENAKKNFALPSFTSLFSRSRPGNAGGNSESDMVPAPLSDRSRHHAQLQTAAEVLEDLRQMRSLQETLNAVHLTEKSKEHESELRRRDIGRRDRSSSPSRRPHSPSGTSSDGKSLKQLELEGELRRREVQAATEKKYRNTHSPADELSDLRSQISLLQKQLERSSSSCGEYGCAYATL